MARGKWFEGPEITNIPEERPDRFIASTATALNEILAVGALAERARIRTIKKS